MFKGELNCPISKNYWLIKTTRSEVLRGNVIIRESRAAARFYLPQLLEHACFSSELSSFILTGNWEGELGVSSVTTNYLVGDDEDRWSPIVTDEDFIDSLLTQWLLSAKQAQSTLMYVRTSAKWCENTC